MTLKKIKFSVLISTYKNDSSEHLFTSLQSIFDQTYVPDQVVLVIDGPINEELTLVIKSFKEKYPLILDVKPLANNVGLGPALNFGLTNCKNEWVARMDADDISLPNRFERQILFLQENPHIDVLGANVEEFIKVPGDLKRINQAPPADTLFQYSRWRNPINHPTVIFKKSVVQSVNSYEDVPFFEDYYLWLRILQQGYLIDNLPDILVHFRNDIKTIGRRHGYDYMKIEYSFFKKVYRNKIMTFGQFVGNLIIRLPLRLLPKHILSILYHYVLRKS